jgi:hypothetical protein
MTPNIEQLSGRFTTLDKYNDTAEPIEAQKVAF